MLPSRCGAPARAAPAVGGMVQCENSDSVVRAPDWDTGPGAALLAPAKPGQGVQGEPAGSSAHALAGRPGATAWPAPAAAAPVANREAQALGGSGGKQAASDGAATLNSGGGIHRGGRTGTRQAASAAPPAGPASPLMKGCGGHLSADGARRGGGTGRRQAASAGASADLAPPLTGRGGGAPRRLPATPNFAATARKDLPYDLRKWH